MCLIINIHNEILYQIKTHFLLLLCRYVVMESTKLEYIKCTLKQANSAARNQRL